MPYRGDYAFQSAEPHIPHSPIFSNVSGFYTANSSIRVMGLKIIELPFMKAGKGYEFDDMGKNYTILETLENAYRGSHTHPYNQYTFLLRGKARYLLDDGKRKEYHL